MKPIVHLEYVADISKLMQQPGAKHPLVTVVDFADRHTTTMGEGTRISADFYAIIFKGGQAETIHDTKYGRQPHDFRDGILICIAPKQIITIDSEIERKISTTGWGLFFHPDLIRGTPLATKMKDYSFFSYAEAEALHVSDKEKQNLHTCIAKLQTELLENIDDHSHTLIISNIELLLNYCSRYYSRQFITRKHTNHDVVNTIRTLIRDHFQSDVLKNKSLPTVKSLAHQVNLSPNYLSDLLKKETGMNTQDHIHYHLIEAAKNILLGTNHTINQVAYTLGFEYPQYFSKLFKQKTGTTPQEFRRMN